MAYAFKAIDDALTGQPEKQDIFNPTAGTATSDPERSTGGTSQTPAVKTSTEGNLNAGNSNTNVAAGGEAPAPGSYSTSQTTQAANSAAFNKNVGKTSTPGALSSIGSTIAGKSKQLQDASDAYIAAGNKATDTAYSYTEGDVDNAVKGDTDGVTKVGGLLSGTTKPTVQPAFDPGDLSVSDIPLIRSDAGLAKLNSRGKGIHYTAGESAFDTGLQRQDPEFNRIIGALGKQYADLTTAASKAGAKVKEEVSAYSGKTLKDIQDKLRANLQGRSKVINDTNEAEAAAANTKLANLDVKGLSQEELAQIIIDAKRDLDQTTPGASAFIEPSAIDPTKFFTKGGNYSANDFVSGDEAAQFNRIMGLLGTGGQSLSASLPLRSQYSFDKMGLYNLLMGNAMGGYNAKVEADRAAALAAEQAREAEAKAAAQRQADALALAQKEAAAKAAAANVLPPSGVPIADDGGFITTGASSGAGVKNKTMHNPKESQKPFAKLNSIVEENRRKVMPIPKKVSKAADKARDDVSREAVNLRKNIFGR